MSATVGMAMGEAGYDGTAPRAIVRQLAVECPIAIEVNGVAYAVMMGTPADLEDYAVGFALAEGMIAERCDLAALAVAEIEQGAILRLTLADSQAAPFLERVRMRVSEGSCGLCGLESIAEVLRPLPRLGRTAPVSAAAVERALLSLSAHQADGARTGAMHAAAFASPHGRICFVREDVGRHNALDKLIGALARADLNPADGFIIVTARCSYELVEKAVRCGCGTLVAISAPTSLAATRAREAGLRLIALARHDTMLVVAEGAGAPQEVFDGI